MKKVSVCNLSIFLLLFSGVVACQYEYPMVAPPRVSEYAGDSLEEEDAGRADMSGKRIFVSVSGDGDMDGSTWENALDVEGLRNLLTDEFDLSNTIVCLAAGQYLVSATPGAGLNINKDVKGIYGGFSPSSVGNSITDRDPSRFVTILTGDVNADGIANDGDCCMFIVTEGISIFDGITFKGGYIDDEVSAKNQYGAGPVFGINGPVAKTCVEVRNCIFTGNVSVAGNNLSVGGKKTTAGGTCALIADGMFKAHKCSFIGNSATSRGGCIRCQNHDSIAFVDACYFSGNTLSDSFGTCIQLSSGSALINNCTMVGNTGNGGDINGGGAFLVTNTTVINCKDDSYGAFRCETSNGGDTHFINNAFLSERTDGCGFVYQGTDHDITSGGFNLFAGYKGTDVKVPSDVVSTTPTNGHVVDGCYEWTQYVISSITTYAKLSDVLNVVSAFNPTYCKTVTNLGSKFVTWVTPEGFGVDQRGVTRNPDKMQRGSYDEVLQ